MTPASDALPSSKQDPPCKTPVDVDVLVIGAGPTGLTAASEALRNGLSVRIVEKKPTRDCISKALVVHARTMETFSFMGIESEVRSLGAPFAALNLHFNNRHRVVRVDLLNQPWGDTKYPYWLSVPQYDTEQVLERLLRRLGGEVEWSRALRSLTDRGDCVEAVLESEGSTETVLARWIVGCDGGRSTVREQAGITLERTGARTTFLLADVKTTSKLIEDEGYLYFADSGLLILVPMPEPGRWRLIAQVESGWNNSSSRDSGSQYPMAVGAKRLDELILERTGIAFGSHDITWTSQFDLSHGVADRFGSGRIFVAGDAAHIHSPVGGQGLNTGVQDAYNLIWRIAQSRGATAKQATLLLRGYESERRGTAVPMVRGVARMTAIMTSRGHSARHFRSSISPFVVARSFVQAKLARGVGMLNLSYSRQLGRRGVGTHGSGQWREGHRLPNPLLANGERLYDRVRGTGYSWVLWVGGEHLQTIPKPDDQCWLGLPVVIVSETDVAEPAESKWQNRVVLLRPDRYIAAVGPDAVSLHDVVPQSDAADPQEVHLRR